jgi:homeobox protein cut-like
MSRRRDSVTEKYKNIYEDTIDPFRQFKQQERTRANELNPADKLALQFTKLLTGNKYSRLAFVFYVAFLHLLVFFSMYEVMIAEHTKTGKLMVN